MVHYQFSIITGNFGQNYHQVSIMYNQKVDIRRISNFKNPCYFKASVLGMHSNYKICFNQFSIGDNFYLHCFKIYEN